MVCYHSNNLVETSHFLIALFHVDYVCGEFPIVERDNDIVIFICDVYGDVMVFVHPEFML
jgi:hypothetical protein